MSIISGAIDLFAGTGCAETGGEARRRELLPARELAAYEALWLRERTTFDSLARLFRRRPGARPSDLVTPAEAQVAGRECEALAARAGIEDFALLVHGMPEYPSGLRDARHPVEVLYAQGRLGMLSRRGIAIIGTRRPSSTGAIEARRIARHFARRGLVVLSGLAEGIDTLAHRATIQAAGATVAVLGTPLTAAYPPINAELQRRLAREFLLVSQVPIVRYSRQGITANRHFFRERDATLAALARAVVIVEAGDRSGALICARHALEQGRPVFIADRCRRDGGLSWPARLMRRGAVAVRCVEQIDEHLPA